MYKWFIPILMAALVGCEPPPLTDNGVVKVFGTVGMGNGAFSYPRGIARATDGCLFIVDKTARVQRFNSNGEFETEWKMPAKDSGKPVGLTIHPDGRVFVADTHYHRVIVYDRDGKELARFGGVQGNGDGEFQLPTDVTFDKDGFIYVSEYNGNDRITRWTPDYKFHSTVAIGDIAGKPLARPAAIFVDDEQTLWVADACNHRILRFTLDGQLLTQFGQMGTEPGQLRYPYDLDIRDGILLICEYGNSRLQWFDKSGKSLGVWGQPGRAIGELYSPWGAAYGFDDVVYALDSQNNRVQIIKR